MHTTSALPPSTRPAVYGAAARSLHWLMALAIVSLVVSGLIMVSFDKHDSLRAAFYSFHKSAGATVLGLVLLRLAVRLARGVPADSPRLPRWERAASHAAHWALYALMAATPVAGWAISDFYGYGVHLFGLPLPKLFPTAAEYGPVAGFLHRWLAYGFIALVGLHLAAVAKHRYLDRDCVMHRMA